MKASTLLANYTNSHGLADKTAALQIHRQEIELWNPKLSLVEAGGNDLVIKHFLDSLVALPVFRQLCFTGARCADIGSGAGFPGIPLAIALPDSQWTLVEKQLRRCNFLLNAKALIKLDSLLIRQERLEDLPAASFDIVTCRAFTPLDLVSLAALRRIVVPGGFLLLFKARREKIAAELAACQLSYELKGVLGDPAPLDGGSKQGEGFPPLVLPKDPQQALVLALKVPDLDEERHLVVIKN